MAEKGSIFCDGACSGNGTRNAVGGWAWAFWPGTARGEPLHYGAGRLKTAVAPATNQRAELTALLEAVRWAAAHPQCSLKIYTDSMYSLNCTTKWGPGWKRKGWKRDSGEPLQNLDLIKPLVELWKPCWPIQHVRGHQTGSGPEVHGNNWVDRAAVAAAHGTEIASNVLAIDIPTPSPRMPNSSSAFNLDKIEHVVEPNPVPVPVQKKVYRPETTIKGAADVKQTDIRTWFRPA